MQCFGVKAEGIAIAEPSVVSSLKSIKDLKSVLKRESEGVRRGWGCVFCHKSLDIKSREKSMTKTYRSEQTSEKKMEPSREDRERDPKVTASVEEG